MSENIIEVKNLNKIYDKIIAVKDLTFEINKGKIIGLLGPNGCGKTTTIAMILGLLKPTSGEVIIKGKNIEKERINLLEKMNFISPYVELPKKLTVEENLKVYAGLYGVKKKERITDTILKLVSLDKQANSYARSLSGGMKRRLLIAKALVHQPPIIFLDEPTAGVDVELRKNLWENVKSLNNQGVTIILTTHYLKEAEEMCTRIGILNKGNLVALDSTKNLLNKIQTKKVTFKINKKIEIQDNVLDSLKIISNEENEICVSYEKSKINIEEIINLLKKANVQIYDISTDDGDLEDVFLLLTKN